MFLGNSSRNSLRSMRLSWRKDAFLGCNLTLPRWAQLTYGSATFIPWTLLLVSPPSIVCLIFSAPMLCTCLLAISILWLVCRIGSLSRVGRGPPPNKPEIRAWDALARRHRTVEWDQPEFTHRNGICLSLVLTACIRTCTLTTALHPIPGATPWAGNGTGQIIAQSHFPSVRRSTPLATNFPSGY